MTLQENPDGTLLELDGKLVEDIECCCEGVCTPNCSDCVGVGKTSRCRCSSTASRDLRGEHYIRKGAATAFVEAGGVADPACQNAFETSFTNSTHQGGHSSQTFNNGFHVFADPASNSCSQTTCDQAPAKSDCLVECVNPPTGTAGGCPQLTFECKVHLGNCVLVATLLPVSGATYKTDLTTYPLGFDPNADNTAPNIVDLVTPLGGCISQAPATMEISIDAWGP